jgi:hypothetical protein
MCAFLSYGTVTGRIEKQDFLLDYDFSYEIAFPARWSDLYERFPGRKRWFLRSAFYFNWFLDFMIPNCGYLLLNKYVYEDDSDEEMFL